MDKKILIAFENAELFANIFDVLSNNLRDEIGSVKILRAKNEGDALLIIDSKNLNLLIVDLCLAGENSNNGGNRGLALLQKLSDFSKNIPSILVVHALSSELYEQSLDLYECRLVTLGEEFESALSRACQTLLKTEEKTLVKPEKNALIQILHDKDRNFWSYKMDGWYEDHRYTADGILEIDKDMLEELIDDSRDIERHEFWEKRMERIGKKLVEQIFENNVQFRKRFSNLKNNIGDMKNIRFQFYIERNVYPILFEAMYEEDEITRQPYWMLKSPIYRKLKVCGEYPQILFNRVKCEAEINCLIIKSDVTMEKGDKVRVIGEEDSNNDIRMMEKPFAKLENTIVESRELYKMFKSKGHVYGIGKVKLIDSEKSSSAFIKEVEDTLAERHWHIVHYAGHSYYDNKSNKGYFLFPGSDYSIALDIRIFSRWIRKSKTQMIFLSSCHSSEEDFVFELAQNGIPAIIGFRWDIDDALAAKYAIKFYQHLFADKYKLEQAFLTTRQEMYNIHKRDRIWASPMLILQCQN